MMALLALGALAADGRWLGPGASSPGAAAELEVEAGLNAGIYGVGPQVGARGAFSPVRAVSLGASVGWIAPTATLSSAGGRVLLFERRWTERQALRVAAVARSALATRFDGGLGLLLGGAGFAAELEHGRLLAGASVPVLGLQRGHRGLRWLPGLWDASVELTLGQERRVALRLGVATSLVLVTAGCSGQTRWGWWQVGLVGDGVVNALGAGAGTTWGRVGGSP